jgi:hypothetical protein
MRKISVLFFVPTFSKKNIWSFFVKLFDEIFSNRSGSDLDVNEGLQVMWLNVRTVSTELDQGRSKMERFRLK